MLIPSQILDYRSINIRVKTDKFLVIFYNIPKNNHENGVLSRH